MSPYVYVSVFNIYIWVFFTITFTHGVGSYGKK